MVSTNYEETRRKSLTGFQNYMSAVQLKGVSREQKVQAIVDTFAQDCVLVTSEGRELKGKDEVKKFYTSVLEGMKLLEERIFSFKPLTKRKLRSVLPFFVIFLSFA
jgi:hypothetical protein